jgi:hypothetical protein
MDEDKDTATAIAGGHIPPPSPLITGFLSSSTGLFTVETPIVYGGQYSVAPAITRLSETSFGISYYDSNSAGSSVLMTRRGLVNPNDLSIDRSLSLPLCLSLSLSPSLSLSLSLDLSLNLDLSLSLCLSVCLSLDLSISISLSISLNLSLSVSVCLSVSLSLSLSLSLDLSL